MLLLASNVAAGGEEGECFCPVDEAVGQCRNAGQGRSSHKPYKELTTQPYFGERSKYGGEALCFNNCALDDKCKGYGWRSDIEFNSNLPQDDSQPNNCYLYDYVPDKVRKQNSSGKKDFTSWSCFALSGENDGYTLFPPGRYDGGKCSAPIYSGTTTCGFYDFISPPYCAEVHKAATIEECKDNCDKNGILCEGFDFDQGKADNGSVSCWERRFKPTGAGAPTSRKDYTDWFCHAKNCKC